MSDEDQTPEAENEDAATTEDGGEGEGQEEGKGGKKKLLIILLSVLLLIGGGGAAAYFTGMLDSFIGGGDEAGEGEDGEHGDDHGEGKDGDHGDKKGKKKSKKKGDDHGDDEGGYGGDGTAFLEMPTMIVNLNTEDGTPRYLRLTVQLELDNESDKADVEAVIPRVIDQFQTYLRELRVKDLRGSAGIYRLQMELLWRVNQAADPVEVKDVLFQEILIQ